MSGRATPSATWFVVPPWTRPRLVPVIVAAATFVLATIAIAFVESPPLSIENGAPLYLLPVVVAATLGPVPAVIVAVLGFVAYDVLFIAPRFTLTVDDPREWLDLLVFLVVGLAVGRLAGSQAQRAEEAVRRLREARALFAVSRTLVTSASTADALPQILDILSTETAARGVLVTRGTGDARVVAVGATVTPGSITNVLVRKPGAEPAKWVRAHVAGRGRHEPSGDEIHKVVIEAEGEALGALWVSRPRRAGPLKAEETRLLSLAADQLGLAWRREQLASEAKEVDLAIRSEAAQAALLQSVSHDLRTPLASIRATAGGLADPAVAWSDADRRAAGQRIDAEVARLDRLVGNVLDLSRIQGGNLVPRLEPHDLGGLLEPALARLTDAGVVPGAAVTVDVPADLAPVLVDAVLLDQAFGNLLENAVQHAPGSAITITARAGSDTDYVAVRFEDDGPGVPESSIPRLFERFYRAPGSAASSRRGLGIGLAVVRGAIEAMGGTVVAESAARGGLAIVVNLPTACPPEG